MERTKHFGKYEVTVDFDIEKDGGYLIPIELDVSVHSVDVTDMDTGETFTHGEADRKFDQLDAWIDAVIDGR